MRLIIHYIQKIAEPIKNGSTQAAAFLAFVYGLIESLSSIQLAIMLLIFSLCFDFFTGIVASYVESLRKVRKDLNYFERVHHFFYVTLESNKFRKTVIKTLTYFSLLFVVYFIEIIFFIEEQPLTNTKDDLTLSLYAIGGFIGIETYSAVFENAKRAGFDILESFKRATTGISKILTEIKNIVAKFKL